MPRRSRACAGENRHTVSRARKPLDFRRTILELQEGMDTELRSLRPEPNLRLLEHESRPAIKRKPAVPGQDHRGDGSAHAYELLDHIDSTTEVAKVSEGGDGQKIHWVTLATAITFFLAGVGTCAGHHMFLTSVNLHAAENQVCIGRYSLALAFLAKAALSAACAVAFSQQMWHFTIPWKTRGLRRGC